MNISDDYEIIKDEKAPKGRRIVKKGLAVKAEVIALSPDEVDLSDDELRDEIEELTGKRPHHRTGREKLIAEWEAVYGT